MATFWSPTAKLSPGEHYPDT